MPNRILRDGILSSEAVNSLSWAEEVFYRRLMSAADDYGRFSASPKLLRAACYPLHIDKVSDSDIGKWIAACATAGLVRVYPASDGKRYIELLKFGQQIRSKSKFPPPLDSTCDPPDSTCEQLISDAHLVGDVVGDDTPLPPEGGDPPRKVRTVTQEAERPESVPEEVWRDFIALRKSKRAPLTPTALEVIEREAGKAGMSLADALRTSCAKGWQGFDASWLNGATVAPRKAWAGAK